VSAAAWFDFFFTLPKPGTKPSLQARLVAVTLAGQTGRAFRADDMAPSAH
jgi:hypothetical protein